MLFQRNYSTPGPGIKPDEPEKFGLAAYAKSLHWNAVRY